MKEKQFLLVICLISIVTAVTTSMTFAQSASPRGAPETDLQRLFEIRRITYDLVKPPRNREATTGGGASGSALRDRWLQLEVEFSTMMDWTDDLTVKYFLLAGEGRDVMLFGGEVTHINVARDRRHFSGMFMHPNAVERFGRGKIQAMRVELWYRGQRVAETTEPKAQTRWWDGREAMQGHLLSPKDTPWALIAHERYEAIKSVR